MLIFNLLACFLLASWGVYTVIPNRGAAGAMASMVVVGALLAFIYLVKHLIVS